MNNQHPLASIDPSELRAYYLAKGTIRPSGAPMEPAAERITPHAEGVSIAPLLALQGSRVEREAVRRPIWADARAARRAER